MTSAPRSRLQTDFERILNDACDDLERRDPVTGLRNKRALDERCRQNLEQGRDMWAFVIEVDRLEEISDRSDDDPDELLKSVTNLLSKLAASFSGLQDVFRHRDGFYCVGLYDRRNTCQLDVLQASLGLVSEEICKLLSAVRVPNDEPGGLSLTPRIGWLALCDVPAPQSARAIRECLRCAAGAKGARNGAVRYSLELQQSAVARMKAAPEAATNAEVEAARMKAEAEAALAHAQALHRAAAADRQQAELDRQQAEAESAKVMEMMRAANLQLAARDRKAQAAQVLEDQARAAATQAERATASVDRDAMEREQQEVFDIIAEKDSTRLPVARIATGVRPEA